MLATGNRACVLTKHGHTRQPFTTDSTQTNLHLRQIHILDIVRIVVILDLTSRPINTFDAKDFSLLNRRDGRNWVGKKEMGKRRVCETLFQRHYRPCRVGCKRTIGVPAIVHGGLLFPGKFLGVDRDDSLDHFGRIFLVEANEKQGGKLLQRGLY